MNTQDVYKRFGTPLNLQDHMLTVAGLVCALKEHWNGEQIDWDGAVRAALLHDIGNVIEFDLDKFPELLGPELPRLEYWLSEQKRLIAEYGADEHVATDKMLDQLQVAAPIREAIQVKSFGNSKAVAASNKWLVKILLYCDMRVMPDHISTLDERMAYLKTRYKKYRDRPDFPELVAACKAVEQAIQASLDASVDDVVTGENAAKHREMLLRFSITEPDSDSATHV